MGEPTLVPIRRRPRPSCCPACQSPALTQARWFRAEDKRPSRPASRCCSCFRICTRLRRGYGAGRRRVEGVLQAAADDRRLSLAGGLPAEARAARSGRLPDALKAPAASACCDDGLQFRSSEQNAYVGGLDGLLVLGPKPEASCNLGCAGARRAGRRARSRDPAFGRLPWVLAELYWNREGPEFEGPSVELATVERGSTTPTYHPRMVRRWDYPALHESRPQDIAVPHPEFRVSGK